jgi:hypothetical protein
MGRHALRGARRPTPPRSSSRLAGSPVSPGDGVPATVPGNDWLLLAPCFSAGVGGGARGVTRFVQARAGSSGHRAREGWLSCSAAAGALCGRSKRLLSPTSRSEQSGDADV